jgi:hypothetical protein
VDIQQIIETYAERLPCGQSLKPLLDRYDYHPELTAKLDRLARQDFTREILYEIVLWKLSRFTYVEDEVIAEVNGLKDLPFDDLEKSKPVLESLLRANGVRLPMASTILRFRNPKVFQIIDERTYRIVCAGEPSYPSKPPKVSDGYLQTSVSVYFKYLRKLKDLADHCGFDYTEMDRALYQLDIELGNKLDRPQPKGRCNQCDSTQGIGHGWMLWLTQLSARSRGGGGHMDVGIRRDSGGGGSLTL